MRYKKSCIKKSLGFEYLYKPAYHIHTVGAFKYASSRGILTYTHYGHSNIHTVWVFKYTYRRGIQIYIQKGYSNIHRVGVFKYT